MKYSNGSIDFKDFNFEDEDSNPFDVDINTIKMERLHVLRRHYESDKDSIGEMSRYRLTVDHSNWLYKKRMKAMTALRHIKFFEDMIHDRKGVNMHKNIKVVIDWEAYRKWYKEATLGGAWFEPDDRNAITFMKDSPVMIEGRLQWILKVGDTNSAPIDMHIPVEFVAIEGSRLVKYTNFNLVTGDVNDLDLTTVNVNVLELTLHNYKGNVLMSDALINSNIEIVTYQWAVAIKAEAQMAIKNIEKIKGLIAAH